MSIFKEVIQPKMSPELGRQFKEAYAKLGIKSNSFLEEFVTKNVLKEWK